MDDKKLIDQKRSNSGRVNIGTEEDGAILEMPNIKNRHFILKERAIYELITADQVDPERKNIQIPNMIQRIVFDQCVYSALVSKIFLTAKTLFRSQFFDPTIDADSVVLLALDGLKEFGELEKNINSYLTVEKNGIDAYEMKRTDRSRSYAIPAIPNIESICKTIFQKADQIEQILMEIIIQFFSGEKLNKQSHFPKFEQIIKNKFGEQDPFYLFLNKVVYFMRIVREIRNALDHRLTHIKIMDFEIRPDNSVLTPTIEYKDKDLTVSRQSLSDFLRITMKNMLYIFETTMAHVSAKKVKQDNLQYQLREIPETERHNKHIRFAFWSARLGFFFY